MRRREFVAILGAAAASGVARAQPGPVRRLGVLMSQSESDPEAAARRNIVISSLRELGWREGENLRAEYRFGAGNVELMRAHAAELVANKPDAILVSSATVLRVVRAATSDIPIVFGQVSDPVGAGFVANLAKPGGTLQGSRSSSIRWGVSG